MAIFVSQGSPEHANLFGKSNRKRAPTSRWTVVKAAKPGDLVLLYVRAPYSGVVKIGRVTKDRQPRYEDYPKSYTAEIAWERDIHPVLQRDEIVRAFPEWKWARSPQSHTQVPAGIEKRLLAMLDGTSWRRSSLDEKKSFGNGAGFGSSEQNRKVEQAAVNAVIKLLETDGWRVFSMESERCGYDLQCRKGGKEKHVEVKGVSGEDISFIVTEGERKQAAADPRFELRVVTEALSRSRKFHCFKGRDLAKRFQLTPLAYQAKLA